METYLGGLFPLLMRVQSVTILDVISVTSFVGREGLQPGNFALEGATRTD